MAIIKLNKKNIFPNKKTVSEIVFIGISVLIVRFVIDSFGMMPLLDTFPVAMKLFIIVAIGVYLRRLFDIIPVTA